jgi:EAL domain-containing protein (putative c-di-GMP-specific phosphodiesterase class I)
MPHVVDEMLEVVRTHLGMDVAFVSRFEGGQRVFGHVAATEGVVAPAVGEGHATEATYCTRIVDGSLPRLIDDAAVHDGTKDLPVTAELGIRAYAGVPIPMPDGKIYGTLCAYSGDPNQFNPDDVHALELAAALIAHRLQDLSSVVEADPERRDALTDEVRRGRIVRSVFQPIVDLRTGRVDGYEALARFDDDDLRSPEDWFALARRLGFDTILQRQAAITALQHLPYVPDGQYVAVNLSDVALLDPTVQEVLHAVEGKRLVVELTEHEQERIDDDIEAVVVELRRRGMRIALDDVGAGYAGLDRVLRLMPEIIKLDRELTAGVWGDKGRQAMIQAFTTFSRAVGTKVVAEGIETQHDADALRILGVQLGQGFLLGEPAPAPWSVDV